MDPDSKYVEFTTDWTFLWDDYDRIGNKAADGPRHYFVTSFRNVSFRWYTVLFTDEKDESMNAFSICYDDGPLDEIKGVECIVGIIKTDQSLGNIYAAGVRDYLRDARNSWGWSPSEAKNSTIVRSEYELEDSDRLTYQITMQIPTETFVDCMPNPTSIPCSRWSVELFYSISSNDEESPWLSDTKIAGRDGIVFNCHKLIVGAQSKPLKTIFLYPPSSQNGSEGDPAPDKKKTPAKRRRKTTATPKKRRKASALDEHSTIEPTGGDVYEFPNLCAASLKSVLEYLYTGKATTATLTVTELIEMGDAGEQYDLKPLKLFCAAELWKRVIEKPVSSAFQIARFADLHDVEMKYLKHRAFDVIAENYERLRVKIHQLAKRFGGMRGEELSEELVEYMGRRLRPKIKQ